MPTPESTDQTNASSAPALLLSPGNHQVFQVIDPSEDGEGSAIGARHVSRCVKRAGAQRPDVVTPEWVAEFAGTSAILDAAGRSTSPGLLTASASRKTSKVFAVFVRPPKSNLSSTQIDQLEAAIGIIAVACASVGRKISSSIAGTYATLMRSGAPRQGRHPDFSTLMAEFPKTLDAWRAWVNKDTDEGIRRFAAAIVEALETPIQPPAALVMPGSETLGIAHGSGAQPLDETAKSEANAKARATPHQPPAEANEERERSLIGWLRGRGDQAGHRWRFGSQDLWDKQTVDELIATCGRIQEALAPGHPDRHFAFVAVISLVTSLPASKVFQIKLKPTTEIWLDLRLGVLRWLLTRLLNSERADGLSPEDIDASQIVDICLPRSAAAIGAEFAKRHPDAADLLDLVASNLHLSTPGLLIERYRQWLRSIGYESPHGVEDARFARSLGQIYRMLSGDVAAAMLAFDLDECSLGMLHYVQLPRSFIQRLIEAAYSWVGLGSAVTPELPDSPVGSQVAMSADDFATSLKRAQRDIDDLIIAMRAAETVDDLFVAFHLLVHLRALLAITLSAGRGDRLERLTWAAVFGHTDVLHLADKDIDEYTKDRLVAICHFLRTTLDGYVQDISLFCERAEALGVSVTDKRGRRFGTRSPSRACFVVAQMTVFDGITHATRAGISAELLGKLAKKYFGALNAGRHTLVSLAVQAGVDPNLLKVLTGHYRGHAEPFSDGQWVAPADALASLGLALNWILQPLVPEISPPETHGVIDLMQWNGSLPMPASEEHRSAGSRVRVLAKPFDGYTILSLRVIDHLRQRLTGGDGPSHLGANFAANLMLVNWTTLSDLKTIWRSPGTLVGLGPKCVAATWQRPNCIAHIRRPLVGPVALACHALASEASLPAWEETCKHIAAWLKGNLPMLSWPEDNEQVLAALSALLARWLRVNVPPFLLTASSPRITAPTANATSLRRLIDEPQEADADEVLVHPAARPRGHGNRKIRESELQALMKVVHTIGTPRKNKGEKSESDVVEECVDDDGSTDGENWARMKEIATKHARIDTTNHAPAATYQEYCEAEASRWEGSKGDRVKASSLSTYTRLIAPALDVLRRDDDLRTCEEDFWHDFFKYLETSVRAPTMEKRAEIIKDRQTAARRFVKLLATLGYNIPAILLDSGDEVRHDGMRRSAASTLLLETDQKRTTSLMARHFAEIPLTRMLAPVYADLRFEAPLRSIEAAVVPLVVVTGFGYLVITTDGFAHLKSIHARRIIYAGTEFAARIQAAADAVALNCAGARWLFLTNNRADWSLIEEIEEAFSAALKQATGDQDARPHATRTVAPLEQLFPGWEGMLRRFLQGKATTAECVEFCAAIRRLGFSHLESVIISVGHGHGLTFIRYYLAIWDLLLSVYAQASLTVHSSASQLVKASGTTVHAAYRQAESRAHSAGASFDPWTWARSYRPKSSKLVDISRYSATSAPTAVVKKTARGAAVNGLKDAGSVKYLALRATGQLPVAAARATKVMTSVSAELETIFSAASIGHLTERHQGKPSAGGIKSEIKFLEGVDGALLIKHLRASSHATLDRFSDALTPKRAGAVALPAPEAIRSSLTSFSACLPPSLAVLAQYGEDVLTPDQIARIHSVEFRVLIGSSDRDLGKRPRISIVPAADPTNPVLRARRTSSVRCVIAAIQLLKTHTGS